MWSCINSKGIVQYSEKPSVVFDNTAEKKKNKKIIQKKPVYGQPNIWLLCNGVYGCHRTQFDNFVYIHLQSELLFQPVFIFESENKKNIKFEFK